MLGFMWTKNKTNALEILQDYDIDTFLEEIKDEQQWISNQYANIMRQSRKVI